MKEKILDLLVDNGRLNADEIAVMLGEDVEEITELIREMESDGTIAGYSALVNREKIKKEMIQALIEVKVTPQRSEGFDKVAQRIYKFPEVTDCFLMSGGFDLTVVIEGMTMKEVALFVAEKLAPIDSVISTATHFVLKRYKEKGVIFELGGQDEREAIVL